MNVHDFTQLLRANPNAALQFILPSGEHVPAHFHITEVGRIDKKFIDCGGVKREVASCSLQLWTADDLEHRLLSGKLADIIKLAAPILQSNDLSIDVEYGSEVAASYTIENSVSGLGTLQFYLAGKKTDCLAKDRCGVGTATCC